MKKKNGSEQKSKFKKALELLELESRIAPALIGPGDIQTERGGGSNNLIVVDLSNPIQLSAGNYKANSFGRQFTDFSNYNGESFPTKGDVIPLVLVSTNGSYQPIAIGSTNTYTGPFGFSSTAFGNIDTFSLNATTTVYAGIYWSAPFDGVEYRCPVGYANVGSTSSFYYYGVGRASLSNQGPAFPQINTPITASNSGTFSQKWDFNIDVGAMPTVGTAGPGDISANSYNTNNDVLAVDLARPLSLPAGTYRASSFNRQIATLSATESPGSITPALVVAQGGAYVPVAVGASATYPGATAFASVPFGGNDTFTLTQATTIYAAIHWRAPHYVGGPYRMPVGFLDGTGSSVVYYGEGYGAGAALPYVGLACAGTSQATLSRSYDFSVTVEGASPPSGGSNPPTSGNLITNGDFSQGDTGFGSQYVLTPGNIGGAQTYDVASALNVIDYGDHTTGSGKMLGVNGSNIANIIFWQQTVPVVPNTNYTFSYWVSSWYPGPTPLAAKVNGVTIGTGQAPAQGRQWQKVTVSWNSGNLSSADFSLMATQGYDVGGDFAIDDISLVANRPPTAGNLSSQTSQASDSISLSIASSFSDPDNDPITFTATGLPSGLTISSAGLISGTIASTANSGSPYSTRITASDGRGGTVTASFTWTVLAPNRPPVASSLSNRSDITGNQVSFSVASAFSDPDNDSLAFTATGLPSGLTISTAGLISGTIASTANSGSPYSSRITASDGRGGTVSASFTWIVNSYYLVGPGDINGGAFDAANDLLAVDLNRPIQLPAGTYAAGNFYRQLGTIAPAQTTITPVLLVANLDGYMPIAVGSSIAFSGLTAYSPVDFGGRARFSLSQTTTVYAGIYWAAPQGGSMPVAYNGNGSSFVYYGGGTGAGAKAPAVGVQVSSSAQSFFGRTYDFAIEVRPSDPNANQPPVYSPLNNLSDTSGSPISFSVASSFSDPDNDSLTFTATGLPSGLTMSSAGLISGTIASTANSGSPYSTRITASDGKGGTVTASFTWTVNLGNRSPVAGNLTNRTSAISSVVNLSIASFFSDPDNDTLSFSAINLPPGLSVSANGTVTGTVLASASTSTPYTVTVNASDGRGGTATGSFAWVITVPNRPPVVSTLNNRSDITGIQVSFAASTAFADPDNDTLAFTASGLPDGLVISSAGIISGTISNSAAGSSPFTTRITANDGKGGTVTGSFIWTVTVGASIPHNTAFDLIGLTDLRANPSTAGFDGRGIGIAVIDTGIDYAHALFQSGDNPAYFTTSDNSGTMIPVGRDFTGDIAQGSFLPGDSRNRFSSSRLNSSTVNQRNAEFVGSGNAFDNNPDDTNGHGTHVAGIIGARNPDIGVATGSKLIGLKVMGPDGTGSNEDILKALAWVRDNAATYNIKIVNMSLGYGFFQYRGPDDPFLSTISELESNGITVVSAAGNLYGLTPTERNSSTPGIASTLTVGAVWKDGTVSQAYWPEGDTYDYTTGAGRLTSFSQRPGDSIDNGIFAPGALMLSAIPNNGVDPTRGDDLTAELAGTSQAAPVVSGVVALMQDAAFRTGGRYLTPLEVREILFQTATVINDGDNEDDGFARDPLTLQYNLDNNTHANYRMINANSAVAMVRSMFDTPSQADDPNGVISSPVELSPDYTRSLIADINPSLNEGDPLRYSPIVADFQGEIGTDGDTTVGENDVDLYGFNVDLSGALTVRTTRASGTAPIVNTQLRIFDSNGNEITANVYNSDDNDPATDSNGIFDPFSTLRVRLEPGRYFIGVSGQGNAFYNATKELSGIAGSTVLGVKATGPYHLTMDYLTRDPNGLLPGAKETYLQITGAAVQRGFLGGDYLSSPAEIVFPSPDQLDPAYGGTVVDAGSLGLNGRPSHIISTQVADVDLFVMTAPENGSISFDIDSLDYTSKNDIGMAADTFVRAWRVEQDGTLTELGFNDNGYNPDERLIDASGNLAGNDSKQSTSFDAFLKVAVSAGDRIVFGVSDHNNQKYSPLNFSGRDALPNSHVGFYDAFVTFTSNDLNGRIGTDVYNPDAIGSGAAIGLLPVAPQNFSIGQDNQSATGGSSKADIGTKDVDFYAYTAPSNGTIFVDVDSLEANIPDPVSTVINIFEVAVDASGFRSLNMVGTSADPSGGSSGTDPKLGVKVTANRQYYIAISGEGNTSFNPFRQASGTAATSIGTYKLQSNFVTQSTVVSDQPITVFRPANRTRFSSARLGYDSNGSKVTGNDLDTFLYTPTGNGMVSISVLPGSESAASPSFRVFSQTGTNPYVPVNSTVGKPGTININVTAGTKYAIVTSGSRTAITTDGIAFQSAGSSRGTNGAYTVSIDDSKLTTAPPVFNGPATRTFTISSSSALQGFSISDADAGTSISTLTASVDRGTLTAAGKSGTSITFTGTVAQLNSALAQLTFKSANLDATPAKLLFTAKDASGNTASFNSSLSPTENLVTTITDPEINGKKSILIVGTSTGDAMTVTVSGTVYRVVLNGRTVNLSGVTGRILAFGLAGNDTIDMPSVAIATVSYGGEGNDIIRAGSAADRIFGENGADLLAGGLGADLINGGAGNDLLFDGSVAPKTASVSLASTLALWTTFTNPTDANYTAIYNRLTITSDKNSRDTIQGTDGLDLFFASVTDILDKMASERTRFA